MMYGLSILLIIGGVIEFTQATYVKSVIVDTKFGQVRGRRRQENYDIGESSQTDTVDEYLGIPYAAQPVGELRFKRPRPHPGWDRTHDATVPGKVCPQVVYYNHTDVPRQGEDCLNLNIYSPVIHNQDGRFPVLVFIHGGSYEEGAGIRYDGFTLAQHGVVVVTINYRLGLLGFLSNGHSSLPGNYGLLDQVFCLKWIRDNIRVFRGDPDKVTVFGNSAGASSIGLHLISPYSKGLFHQAIIQSGSPFSFWAVYNESMDHEAFARQVADELDCRGAWSQQLDCLMDLTVEEIIENHWDFPRYTPSELNFKPRVDGDVLLGDPLSEYRAGRQHRGIPVLTGVVEDEWARSMGWFFRDLNYTGDMDREYTDGFDRMTFEVAVHHVACERFWWPDALSNLLVHHYTNWMDPNDGVSNRQNYKEMMSDWTMIAPTVQLAEVMSRTQPETYLYLISHTSIHTDPDWWGSYHSLELNYVFGSPFTGYDIAQDMELPASDKDKAFSRNIMKMWTDFAKHGKPTSNPEDWPLYTNEKKDYLFMDTDITEVRQNVRPEKIALWNQLIPTLLASFSESQDGGVSCNEGSRDCWTKATLVIVGVAAVLVILFLVFIVRYIRMKQKLQRVKYLHSMPEKNMSNLL